MPIHRHSREAKARLAKLWSAGLTTQQIAVELGMPRGTVCYLARHLCLDSRPTGPRKIFDYERILDLRAKGETYEGISKLMGMSKRQVSRVITDARDSGDPRARFFYPGAAQKRAAAEAR